MARILIADDEDGVREFMAEVLEDEGHAVSEARDGAEALAAVPSDFEGRARVSAESPAVDMGAMEYGESAEPADFDGWW